MCYLFIKYSPDKKAIAKNHRIRTKTRDMSYLENVSRVAPIISELRHPSCYRRLGISFM